MGLGIGVPIFALLSGLIISGGLADHFSRTDPVRSLYWRSNQPQALLAAGSERNSENDPARTKSYLLRAIEANPLDGRGYGGLAILQQKENEASSRSLMKQAASRSPRNLLIRYWLMQYAIADGNYDDLMTQVDVMLRINPALADGFVPALEMMMQDPKGQVALARVFASAPAWREPVWIKICKRSKVTIAAATTLVDDMTKRGKPLTQLERMAWVERLIAAQEWRAAYAAWSATLASGDVASVNDIYDGSFKRPPQNAGFGWRIFHVDGASAEQRTEMDASYLHLAFEDRRVPFGDVSQLLALQPGEYLLRGKVRSDGLRSERGLQWTVTCAEGPRTRIAESERFTGAFLWRDFKFGLVVPDQGCGAQWLLLQIAARIPAERQIGGEIDFTDLHVEPVQTPK